jgi:hypothetical protein
MNGNKQQLYVLKAKMANGLRLFAEGLRNGKPLRVTNNMQSHVRTINEDV